MKVDLKPENKSKIKLFANSGEAIVFWLSLAGLLFLALVSLFRFFYLKEVVNEYNSIARNVNPIIIQIEKLKEENKALKQSQNNLIKMIEDTTKQLKSEILNLREEITMIQPLPDTTAKKEIPMLPDPNQ